MKVLIVCSGNIGQGEVFSLVNHQSFIYEQTESLKKLGVEIDFFIIRGKGLTGYLRNLLLFRKKIARDNLDVIHAHYGLSGIIAVLQNRYPVVTSFIGEMNIPSLRFISKFAARLSSHSIFVSEQLRSKSNTHKNYSIIPYGVDMKVFFPIDKNEARKIMAIPENQKICLFSSSRDRIEKNYDLAEKAIGLCGNIRIMELMKGYTRSEVNLLINACDFIFLTSLFEGSPQIIKEAMACNCPIISTNVGDIGEIIKDTDGCYLTNFDPTDIAGKIKLVLADKKRTNGRQKIRHLEINEVAGNILNIYKKVLEPT